MPSDAESSEQYRRSKPPPEGLAAAISQILSEMRLLYSVPRQVKTDADASAYVAILTQAMTDECKEPAVLLECWRSFKRTHGRGFWPTPGELCAQLRQERADKRAYEPERIPEAWRLSRRDPRAPERVTHEVRERTLAALAQADCMANGDSKLERAYGVALTRLGLALIARNGDPL